jgi:hypothetical protein
MAQVRSDTTPAYNGVYQKGTGSTWTRVADLPDAIVYLSPTGGTTNAIIALPSPQLPENMEQKVYLLTIETTNTDAVTLSIDGGTTYYPVKGALDTSLVADALLGGTQAVLTFKNDKFQLIVSASVDASAILADAQAAAVTAVNAAASVDLPAVTANTMLVDNNGATAREAKTFAQVRALLQVPSFSDLPFVSALENGVSSANTAAENAAALNAIAIALPAEGGTIYVSGVVSFDAEVDIEGRSNIRFVGAANVNAGANTPSRLLFTGTGTGNGINAKSSVGCGLDGCDLLVPNTSTFTGKILNFDKGSGSDTNGPFFKNALLFTGKNTDSGIIGVSLDGATGGVFSRMATGGKGKHVYGQQNGANAFSNSMSFEDCQFRPEDNYPVWGLGWNWSFKGGYAQAGAVDGVGRFIQGSDNCPFFHLTVEDLGLYDVLNGSTGTVWLQNLVGKHLAVRNITFGANNDGINYGMILRAVQGLIIENNDILGNSSTTQLVGFDTSAGSGVNNFGRIWCNEINNGFIVSNIGTANDQIDIDFNWVSGGGSGTVFVQKPFNGPTAASGTSKAMWRDDADNHTIKANT